MLTMVRIRFNSSSNVIPTILDHTALLLLLISRLPLWCCLLGRCFGCFGTRGTSWSNTDSRGRFLGLLRWLVPGIGAIIRRGGNTCSTWKHTIGDIDSRRYEIIFHFLLCNSEGLHPLILVLAFSCRCRKLLKTVIIFENSLDMHVRCNGAGVVKAARDASTKDWTKLATVSQSFASGGCTWVSGTGTLSGSWWRGWVMCSGVMLHFY